MNIENNEHDEGVKVSKYVCLGAFTVDVQDRIVYETESAPEYGGKKAKENANAKEASSGDGAQMKLIRSRANQRSRPASSVRHTEADSLLLAEKDDHEYL